MKYLINVFKRGLIQGWYLIFNEFSITFTNFLTTILISYLLWFSVFVFYFSNQFLSYLQDRLDFSIYFKPETSREEIEKIQRIIINFPGVERVEFISHEAALEKFKQESKINPVIERALSELKINPLVDYLIVKAKTSDVYLKISDYLLKSPYNEKIDYISYFENQKVIKRVISFSNYLKIITLGIIVVSWLFAGLIIFNNLYVSISNLKEEIEILQLLGAGNWFIRSPFIFYTLFFSLISYIISIGGLIIFLEKTKSFWPLVLSNFSLYHFVLENFLKLNLIIFGLIIFINLSSTLISIQKHLRL